MRLGEVRCVMYEQSFSLVVVIKQRTSLAISSVDDAL